LVKRRISSTPPWSLNDEETPAAVAAGKGEEIDLQDKPKPKC
jgi:hypothetical protein